MKNLFGKKILCCLLVVTMVFGSNASAYASTTTHTNTWGNYTLYASLSASSSKVTLDSTSSSSLYLGYTATLNLYGEMGDNKITYTAKKTYTPSSKTTSMHSAYTPYDCQYSGYYNTYFTGNQTCVYTYYKSSGGSSAEIKITTPAS